MVLLSDSKMSSYKGKTAIWLFPLNLEASRKKKQNLDITFHGLQLHQHQFSQFAWLAPLYHAVILEVESYMLQVGSNSSVMLLRSGFLKKDSNMLQNYNLIGTQEQNSMKVNVLLPSLSHLLSQ